MSEIQTGLLQKVVHKKTGKELDISFVKDFTYAEVADMSGPRVIMKFDDKWSLVRNFTRVQVGDELTITVADPVHRDGLNETFDVVIFTMPYKAPLLTLNCFPKTIKDLKTPAVKARLFSDVTPAAILKELMPGVKYDLDDFKSGVAHLLPGDRRSLVIRKLAKEYGANIFFNRKTLYMKDLHKVFKQDTDLEYSEHDPQAENQVINYHHLNKDDIIKDRIQKHYWWWDIVEGFQYSKHFRDREPERACVGSENMGKVMIPVGDMQCMGNGNLRPGLPIKFIWHSSIEGMPLDESLPVKAVTGTVSHYMAMNNYFCRVKLLMPAEMVPI